jgi:hypothetical protein
VSPEQPQPRGKPSRFELKKRFDQRFYGNDLSLTGLDTIAGPEGDRFRLFAATLRALGGEPMQRTVWHPDYQEWVFHYTVAMGPGWSICLLHVPRSVLEGPTNQDDFHRLVEAIRLIWDHEDGGSDTGISCVTIFSWKSHAIFYGLRLLKDRLRERDGIRIDFRVWDDIGLLEEIVSRHGKRSEEADLRVLMAERSTGFEITGRAFFCLPPPEG